MFPLLSSRYKQEPNLTDLLVDVINVVSVTDKAEVKQMNDDADDEVHEALYWRQALDVRTHELSVCFTPPLS